MTKRFLIWLTVLIASPSAAQTGPTTQFPSSAYPNPCTYTAANQCQGVGTGNPLPVTVTGGSSSTRTTAAGTSDTQAVPVQGVTGGIPQRTTRADDSAIASEATLGTLFKSGQSIGNTGFAINGSLPAYATTPTFNIGTAPNLTVLQGTSPWVVNGSGYTQPISAASLPLPSGAATSALQATYVGYNETTGSQAVAASGSTTATYRTPPSWANYFNVRVSTDQAATVILAETLAGGGPVVSNQATIGAGGGFVTLRVAIVGSNATYAGYVGFGTTAGNARVATSFSAN